MKAKDHYAHRGLLILSQIWLASKLFRAIYNVYFHPLSKFPGPRLAAATALPLGYNAVTGRLHVWVEELHQKYGPVVRFLPDTISYIDDRAWKDIYGHRINGRGDMPKNLNLDLPTVGSRNSLLMMGDEDHSRARRLVSHAMSDKALREQQEIIAGYVSQLMLQIGKVADMKDGTVDILKWYNFTTFDVVADLAFGEPLGMLSQGEWTPWMFAINKTIPLGVWMAIFKRFFPSLNKLFLKCIPAKTMEPITTHIHYSRTQVDKRLARETERPDFWRYILRNQGKEEGVLSTAENHAMGMTLMVAGSETTATLLSGLTWHLLSDRTKYERLVREIRAFFTSSDEINMDSLTRLPYLSACVEEGLRLYPPTPIGQQRRVPLGGRTVCGEFLPQNTFVTVSHWAAYRSPANWHKANEFQPERWLLESRSSGEFINDNRAVFNPFSFGPRNCVGKNLAYHEVRLVLSNLLWNFDLSLSEESNDWGKGQKVYGLYIKPPLFVRPTPVTR